MLRSYSASIRTLACLIAFFDCLQLVISLDFAYEDLVALKDCHPYDSCKRNSARNKTTDFRNCRCDPQCSLYGDCCLDSEYSLDLKSNNQKDFSCLGPHGLQYSYIKTTCASDWSDGEIMDLCLQAGSSKVSGYIDPVASLPVTSKKTNITYANYYCAICNSDSRNIDLWNAGWECETVPQSDNITVILKDNVWGTYYNDNAGNSKFTQCKLYPVTPELLQPSVRKCVPTVSTCSNDWVNETVQELCHSYTSVVYGNRQNYRNIHCAICNFKQLNDTSCYNFFRIKDLNHPSFAALFDFSDPSGSKFVGSNSLCKENEIWDPFFGKCRNVICGKSNQVFSVSRCVDVGDFNTNTESSSTHIPETTPRGIPILFPTSGGDRSVIIFPDGPVTTLPVHGVTINNPHVFNSTEESQSCHKIFLEASEVIFHGNGTVHIHQYNKSYLPGEYHTADGGIWICALPITTNKFSSAITWVSLFGALASCVCLILHLIAFLMVPDLRNLSGKNLASLCLALLIAYISFIIELFMNPSRVGCVALACIMYFSLLAAFCWMNTAAFDIWYTFKLTQTQLRVSSGSRWAKFIAYSIYSWFLPAVAVIIVVVINEMRPAAIPDEYLPNLGANWCWFGHRKALLVFFACPVTLLILMNGIFFISTARIIAETTTATSNSTTSSHHKNRYKMHLRLAVLMGFTWLSGTVAGYLQVEALYYIFVLLNTLQGVFIFLSFTCRRRVWRVIHVTISKWLQSGSSWITNVTGGRSSQNIELRNSPSTSLDGL